jgi:type III secretory pathway lipoprotein EscJ
MKTQPAMLTNSKFKSICTQHVDGMQRNRISTINKLETTRIKEQKAFRQRSGRVGLSSKAQQVTKHLGRQILMLLMLMMTMMMKTTTTVITLYNVVIFIETYTTNTYIA